jgi:hypothetical protein
MPKIMDLHVLAHASPEARVLVIEHFGRGIDVSVGGRRPEHLIHSPKVCIGHGRRVSAVRD